MTFDEWWIDNQHMMPSIVKIDAREAWRAATKTEREACAKVCDLSPGLEDRDILGGEEGAELCRSLAASIRMRSNIESG